MPSSLAGLVTGIALLLGGGTVAAARTQTDDPYPMAQYAKTTAKDGRFRYGCHNYTYGYAINPPAEIWALETVLIDSKGRRLASGGFLSGADTTTGTGKFRFCSATTKPGRFTIKGRFTYRTSSTSNPVDGAIRPTKFKLTLR